MGSGDDDEEESESAPRGGVEWWTTTFMGVMDEDSSGGEDGALRERGADSIRRGIRGRGAPAELILREIGGCMRWAVIVAIIGRVSE